MDRKDKASPVSPQDERDAKSVLENLLERSKALISELEHFRSRLRYLRQEGTVELAHFRSIVRSEHKMLEKLSRKLGTTGAIHITRSSNLPFLDAVWASAKSLPSVVALQKRVVLEPVYGLPLRGMQSVAPKTGYQTRQNRRRDAVVVDVISDGGRKWTKLSLVTNTRLLFDLAKEGWQSDNSEQGSESETVRSQDLSDGSFDIPLVKTAKALASASQQFRVRAQRPTVHLILPRVVSGVSDEVDQILKHCQKAGVSVVCGEQSVSSLPLDQSMRLMAPSSFDAFTSTLNVDCTILLALVSDFSHSKVVKETWFHRGLQRQADMESNENLLPAILYPAMGSRMLVSTSAAVRRMREIVSTIGTPTEKERTAIILGDKQSQGLSTLVLMMQQLSEHTVPIDWQLPIQVVEESKHGFLERLPTEAERIANDMTPINRSVFIYGWAQGITTITSNRVVVKQIEHGLDNGNMISDEEWPKLWLCPMARSLVGKEKRGIKRE